MHKWFAKYQDTGICEVNIDKVLKDWNDKCSIYQWEQKFTLHKRGRGKESVAFKAEISYEQAMQIIKRQGLLKVQDSTFRSASIYKTPSFLQSEIKRLSEIRIERLSELRVLNEVVLSYQNAAKVE